MRKITDIKNIPNPIGPYSTAIVSQGHVYVSGQIGLHPKTGKLVEGGVREELGQILENLSAILAAVNLNADAVVMASIFLTSIDDFGFVNEIYSAWVSDQIPPVRQTVVVAALPAGARIEISIIAELS